MQWSPSPSLFNSSSVFNNRFVKRTLRGGIAALMLSGAAFAQDEDGEVTRPKDAFDYEADFINYLLEQGLFEYATLAVSEASTTFPDLDDRIQVVQVSTLLRQGKTADVEAILSQRDLKSDMKAQAMLLQLAMTFDAMGNSEEAMKRYQEFLKLNEGKDIDDPDVLRYFASAGLRLSEILEADGKYEDANKVLVLVIKTSDDRYLQRKFKVLAAQNKIDQALTQKGKAQTTSLKQATNYADELLWGGNDNYFYMGMGLKAWVLFIQDNPTEALSLLNQATKKSIAVEKSLEEAGVPRAEFPRALLRYVEGLIQWDLAKKEVQNGNVPEAKKQAVRAAKNLYASFLRYEGNPYADRAALAFEDLKVWVLDTFGTELKMGPPSPRMMELMFNRQLDLAKQLYKDGQLEAAETQLLDGLAEYPNTKYTLTALDTLSRIWMAQNLDWELMALTNQVAEQYPDDENASRIMMRVGKKMADEENLYGFQQVMGDFGRNFPTHPSAPGMLYKIASAAAERGEMGIAQSTYDDIITLYPESNYAVTVLKLRAEEALSVENYEEAVKAFTLVKDQARNPQLAAYARLRIADTQLTSGDLEMEKAAMQELNSLRSQLEDTDSSFYEADNRDQTIELLKNVRYRTGQVLLRQAGREKTVELQAQAAKELNNFLKDFPDETKLNPDVMYNLGRLYLQQGQFDKATQTFESLASKYPESEAGKDALYSLVKAALEEGQVEVAQEAVQKMVAQADSYDIAKIYQVAQLMLENERWAEAKESFALVLASPRSQDNSSMRQRALNGMGEASMGEGDLTAAAESFQSLIDDFPTSSIVKQAGVNLCKVYLMQDPQEPAKARDAISAVARILRSQPDKVTKARVDVQLGFVAMAEGDPGKALANWYGVGLIKPDSPELGVVVREALLLSIEQAQIGVKEGNQNRWNLIIELTNQYLENFPMDKVASEMRSLNVQAISNAPKE
ncbi:tetratricopeptide repeat protein [Kiritimatiellota bacterium B12222]|nr:tetratricopeptide repeat protein [Kiritimatiellota bacterium B12222]